MRQDFVDQARARAAGGRRAARAGRGGSRGGSCSRRRWRRSAWSRSRWCSPPRSCASEDTIPAQPGPRLVARHPLVSAGGSMASAFGSVWVADIASERLLRLDPRTRAVEARIPLGGEAWVDAAAGAVWALAGDRLLRIDPSSNRVVKSIPIARRTPAWCSRAAARCGSATRAGARARRPARATRSRARRADLARRASRTSAACSDGQILYLVARRRPAAALRRADRQAPVGGPRAGRRAHGRRRRHRLRGRRVGRVGGRRRHGPHALDARPPRRGRQQRRPATARRCGCSDERPARPAVAPRRARPATSRARSRCPSSARRASSRPASRCGP